MNYTKNKATTHWVACILLTLFLLPAIFVTAQNTEAIERIKKQLNTEKHDSVLARLQHDLFVQYRQFDSALAMQAVNKAIEIAESANLPQQQSLYLLNKGIFLNINGENDAAEALMQQSLSIRKKINDDAGQGYALRSMGNIYYDKNDYQRALEFYLQAAPLFEKAQDQKGLAGNYIWIGNVFNEGLRQFDKATDYFAKSLAIATKIKDTALISYNYNNLGQAYYYDSNYTKATEYYLLSKNLKTITGDEQGVGNAYSNLCNVYYDTKQYSTALLYNDSSLVIRKKHNDKKGIATCYMNGGSALLALKNYPAAYQYFQQSLALGREIDFKEAILSSYDGLSAYYEAMNNPAVALSYYRKFKEASDSVYNAETSEQIATLETKYETGKKEKVLVEQRHALEQKSMMQKGSVVLFGLLALLGYSYYRRFKLKKAKELQAAIMRQQELATLAVVNAEESERRRIAAELHDGVGQVMSAAKMNLSAFESNLSNFSVEQNAQFEKIVNLVDEGCREVRSVSHSMMPNALLKRGLGSAVRDFIDKIDGKTIKINLYTEGLDEGLEPTTESMLYRIIQECVNNVVKHSKANLLDISLIKEADNLSLTIEDNGIGFDTKQASTEGIGLNNLRSRVQFLKGTLELNSELGKGSFVAVHIPLEAKKIG